MNRNLFLLTVTLLLGLQGHCQQPKDMAFNITATYQNAPFSIVLKWKPLAGAYSYFVFRKYLTETAWKQVASLNGTDSVFIDNNTVAGKGFEYEIMANTTPTKYAYIYAGKDLPAVHFRGKLILLIDSTYTSVLKFEINRLISDLIGDGWQIKRHDISRSKSVKNVKSIISADYNADPANTKSLFILGHVPVPYSGNLNPDGHSDHLGAWPDDGYYSDMKGTYTDASVNNSTASRVENRNVPGDGKFDQSSIPGSSVLQSGRVDLFNMPAFSSNDALLIKRYLNKDHAFKIKKINPQRKAIIDDNFGYFNGESFATSGWRSFYSLLGPDSTFAGDYFTEMKKGSYLWSYGCGAGSYTSCSGVGSTSNFASDSLRNIFTMLFGSYFGDWDNQNNLLRAPLASKGWTLTNCWSGRPSWTFDFLGLGETIGLATKLIQNNSGTYSSGDVREVHIMLMGDPSLRIHIIAPPENLKISPINNGASAQLSWKASADPVLGYFVYRADSLLGTFTLLTPAYISASDFIDQNPQKGNLTYMVRAVKLENAYSGTYYNLSQGIMDTVTIRSAISGQLTYDNIYSTPLKNVRLLLNNHLNHIIDSAYTDINGNFVFNNIGNGTYAISVNSNANAGSINPADALNVLREFIQLSIPSDNLKINAGDVDNNKIVDPLDALFINRYYIKQINLFRAGKWLFDTSAEIKVNNSNVIYNIKGICVGDVDASFVPGTKKK